MRALLLAMLMVGPVALVPQARGQTLEESARALSRKIAAKLAAGESVKVSVKNLTSLPASELTRAQTAFSRGLRRNGANPADVILTISENPKGYLLVVELRKGGERSVEMAPFEAPPAKVAVRPAIQRSLIWEQDEPILDVALRGDTMLVLGTSALVKYTRVDGKWERGDSTPVNLPVSRDPRGQISGEEAAVAGPPRAHWKTIDLEPEADGLVHIYDASRQQLALIEGWGSAVAAVNGCGVLATGQGDRTMPDTVTAWDIVDRKPKQVSDSLEFPGPVMELWPAPNGTIAIARNLGTKKYAAYLLTIDCAR